MDEDDDSEESSSGFDDKEETSKADNDNLEVTKEFIILKDVTIFDSGASSEPPNLTDVGLV